MAKYDKRFTLKCDKQFKDELKVLSKHYDLTKSEVIRIVIFEAREGLRCQS